MYFEDNFELSGIIGDYDFKRPSPEGNYWLRLKLDTASEKVFHEARFEGVGNNGYNLLLSKASKGLVVVTTPDCNPYEKRIRHGSSVTVFSVRYPDPTGRYQYSWFFRSVRLDKEPLPAHQDPANIPTLDEHD